MEGLVKICRFFNITLLQFFNDGVEPPMELNALIDEAKKFDAETLELFTNMARKYNKD